MSKLAVWSVNFALAVPYGAASLILSGFLNAESVYHFFYGSAFLSILFAVVFGIRRKSLDAATQAGIWFLPAVISLFIVIYYYYCYSSFIFADHDYTMISEMILNTTDTAYALTGPSGSFLSHHFSPFFLVFTPLWKALAWLFPRLDHLPYAAVLTLASIAALIIWVRYAFLFFRIYGESMQKRLTLFFVWILAAGFPFMRLVQSVHFEILIFLFWGWLLLEIIRLSDEPGKLSWKRVFRRLIFPLILLLTVKEDVAVYLLLFTVVILFSGQFKASAAVFSISFVYLISALLIRWVYFPGGPDWTSYFDSAAYPGEPARNYLLLIQSAGFLPLTNPAGWAGYPVFMIHWFSKHPWHADFISHYIYTILPFLVTGTVLGLVWIRKYTPVLFIVLTLSIIASIRSKDHPLIPRSGFSADAASLERAVNEIRPGDCVYASFYLSPRVPMSAQVFPLWAFSEAENQPSCRRSLLLLHKDKDRDLYYSMNCEKKESLNRPGNINLCPAERTHEP